MNVKWLGLHLLLPVLLLTSQPLHPQNSTASPSHNNSADGDLLRSASLPFCEGNFDDSLKKNANVEARQSPGGETALMIASEYGTLCAVRELIEHGAQIDATTSRGDTALTLAADGSSFYQMQHPGSQNIEVIRFLLDHHADVLHKDSSGRTALHNAASRWQPEIVRELIARGAPVDALTNSHETPLCIAAGGVGDYQRYYNPEHDVLETMRALLNAKADVNASCYLGSRPLDIAVGRCSKSGAASGVQLLLDAGASINNALDSAKKNHCDDVVAVIDKVSQTRASSEALLNQAMANRAAAIPPEARGDFVQANTFFKAAQSENDLDRSIEMYRAAIHIAPWYASAWYNLSLALEKAGRSDEARNALNFYLKIKPEGADDPGALDRQYALQAQSEMKSERSEEDKALNQLADSLRAVLEGKTMYRFWVISTPDIQPCLDFHVPQNPCYIYDSATNSDKVGNGHDGTSIGSAAKITVEGHHTVLTLGTQRLCYGYRSSSKIFDKEFYAWFTPDPDVPLDCNSTAKRILSFHITKPGDGVLGTDNKTKPTIQGTTQVEIARCADDSANGLCSRHDIAIYWYKP